VLLYDMLLQALNKKDARQHNRAICTPPTRRSRRVPRGRLGELRDEGRNNLTVRQ
jgi:hypothetical protein